MAAFFVTGSGTDVGKTFVAAGLLRFWRARGLEPSALKPLVTGFDAQAPAGSDPAVLLAALGRPANAAELAALAPFRFDDPLSPDQAAARAGRRLSVAGVVDACRPALAAARGPMLIEGAGGAMSPVNDRETMLDLALAFGAPVIFVAASYLGALSHALTGLAALKARGADVRLVLVNETPGGVDLADTRRSLAAHWPHSQVLTLARNPPDDAWPAISAALGFAL